MCGIFCVYGETPFNFSNEVNEYHNQAEKMNYRGNTSKKMIVNNKVLMWHRRLAINDTKSKFADQPFHYNGIFCTINGEIYNSEYCKKLTKNYFYRSRSDCEVIIPLYLEYGTQFVKFLQGMFSFVLYDSKKDLLIAGRDHIGMTSMYMNKQNNRILFSSDLKSLEGPATQVPAGNIFLKSKHDSGKLFSYLEPSSPTQIFLPETLHDKLVETVKSHMTNPIGFLLSGGLDSSIIASIASRISEKPIKTFTIGVLDSDDAIASKKVAEYLKSDHTCYVFTQEEAVESIRDVIYAIETFDITTVRASIPMYLMAKKIKEDTDLKVLMSGEVADEIFAGYAYFKYAPSPKELYEETKEKVAKLQSYDCLRAHKCMINSTLEVRVPFGDRRIVDYVMSIKPEYKMSDNKIEKYILRETFKDYLPEEILWRKKEQFSDGVSSEKENIISALKKFAESEISNEELEDSKGPITKEGLLYYKIFNELFPGQTSTIEMNTKSVACSTERALEWMNISEDNSANDPSGKFV